MDRFTIYSNLQRLLAAHDELLRETARRLALVSAEAGGNPKYQHYVDETKMLMLEQQALMGDDLAKEVASLLKAEGYS